MEIGRLRKALTLRGLTPASWVPEASGGREVEATIQPARLLEGERVEARAVGDAEIWPDPVAFLDGTQRSEIVSYAGTSPIIVGEVAAAVRERRGRRLETVVVDRRRLAFGRQDALDAAGDALAAYLRVPLPEDVPPHPVRDRVEAARALDRARGQLEVEVGERYRALSDGWLIIDGSLAETPAWAADPRAIGVSKSHATLPFDGDDLTRYLRLPFGHRSSIFQPQSRRVAPVHAWALRLWPWEGRDLLYGLVRIEVAPSNGTPETADLFSRRLIAERAPVSTPDPRWDRLLYGIHAVEMYLKAGGGKM
jgi:hypothetical protein